MTLTEIIFTLLNYFILACTIYYHDFYKSMISLYKRFPHKFCKKKIVVSSKDNILLWYGRVDETRRYNIITVNGLQAIPL